MQKKITLPFYSLTIAESNRINAVRGFLGFWIFWFHFNETLRFRQISRLPIFDFLLNQGYIAVKIFFALSGFLIFHSFSRLIAKEFTHPVFRFYLKRIFKIFPVWFCVLILYKMMFPKISFASFIENFFLLFGLKPFFITDIIVYQSWSLYVEWMFYLIFPLGIWLLKKSWIFPSLVVFFFVKYLPFNQLSVPKHMVYHTPFTELHYFLYGVFAYYLIPNLRKQSRYILYFVFLAVAYLTYLRNEKAEMLEVYVALSFLVIFTQTTKISECFTRVFSQLGKLSYSFYLIHAIAIESIFYKFNIKKIDISLMGVFFYLGFLIGAFLLALVLAFILYSFIEKKGVILGENLIQIWGKKKSISRT